MFKEIPKTQKEEFEKVTKLLESSRSLQVEISHFSRSWFEKNYPGKVENSFATSLYLQAYLSCLSAVLAFAIDDINKINPKSAGEFFEIFKAKLESETMMALSELRASKSAMKEKSESTVQ